MELKQRMAILNANKKKLREMYPGLRDDSGIYILTRTAVGFKFGYVGQAKRILTRIAEHMVGYQHIDLSIKKHGWKTKENLAGWEVAGCYFCPEEQLNDWEQEFIKIYASEGYQMRNKTAGSQGVGHTAIADFLPAKGYHDGLKQGRENLRRELAHIVGAYLNIELKKNNKRSQNAFVKFNDLLKKEESV